MSGASIWYLQRFSALLNLIYVLWLGGFFVFKSKFIDLISDSNTVLEKEPLEKAVTMNEMFAYKHYDFWHCMDTKRDKDRLEDIYYSGKVPWIINDS